MTQRDVLSQHIDALRGRSFVVGDESATQERIVASLRARRRRKRNMLRCLIWAALALPFGSTSYALIYGAPTALLPLLSRIGSMVEAPRGVPEPRAAEATPAVAEASKAEAVSAPPALALPSVETVREPEFREQPSDTTRRPRARSVAAPREEAVRGATPVESDEALSRRLYARAHELHFVVRDRQAALRAWDEYLARAPQQVLRIEAEFNRALCLVRLGRREEALRELAPFADGTHGSYRRRESSALMRALSR